MISWVNLNDAAFPTSDARLIVAFIFKGKEYTAFARYYDNKGFDILGIGTDSAYVVTHWAYVNLLGEDVCID